MTHLNQAQQSLMAAEAVLNYRKNNCRIAVEDVAREYNVSKRNVEYALKLKDHASTVIVNKVKCGELSIHLGWRIATKLSAAAQEELENKNKKQILSILKLLRVK